MGFAEFMVVLIGLPIIIALAVLVDKHDKFLDGEEDTDIQPLLGVVQPKKQDKEEK